MANRPIFIPSNDPQKLVENVSIEFVWHAGRLPTDKQKNVTAIHEAARLKGYPHILEVSTKSKEEIGRRLSAFNLKVQTPLGLLPIEAVYQGSKVFEHGGPYTDLIQKTSLEAKTDSRLKSSGPIIGFNYFGQEYPAEPKTAFYDWLYLSALAPHQDFLKKRMMIYDGFTDIEFNPLKSVACQARTCAILVSLLKMNVLDKILSSPDWFFSGEGRYPLISVK